MFDISNWYWTIPNEEQQVWSSARVAYIDHSDATYQAWLANGSVPTAAASQADLAATILTQWLPFKLGQGVQIESASTPALSGTYATDFVSTSNISALATGIAAGKALPSGADTFSYDDAAGIPHEFTGPQFVSFGAAVESYCYNLRNALKALVLGQDATLPNQPVQMG
jgi:hypothetical protein